MRDNKLTHKERGFIREYLKTGNGTKAALKTYDARNENIAANIASTNLRKPKIQRALDKYISDELLAKEHLKLLQQKQLNYFVFPKNMEDEEIREHVEANGLELIVIRLSDKGKMAFYSLDDAAAKGRALDMAYKLKGLYAPEKSINLNIETEVASEEIELLAEKLNEVYKGTDIASDGTSTDVMDKEIQDQE